MSKFATASVVALMWCTACTATALQEGVTSPGTLDASQARETVRGRFVIVYGDPPPGSGRPAQRRFTLTDQSKKTWTLAFDESVYAPPGGIESYNGKDVEVQGRVTAQDRLLVESMRAM